MHTSHLCGIIMSSGGLGLLELEEMFTMRPFLFSNMFNLGNNNLVI